MSLAGIPDDYGALRGLQLQAEAAELVPVRAAFEGREVRLTPVTAAAWERMRESASHSGIELVPVSGFRSIRRQTEIIQAKLAVGEPLDRILQVNAAPGYSEHHTGRAVDIGTPGQAPLMEAFEGTEAFRWLKAHAPSFGFTLSYPRNNPHGIAFEPWHWCYRGS